MQRIQLGNAVFEGKNDVYLLGDGSDDTVLIDTGVATPESRDQLRAGLAEYDRTFGDVDAILLTHWHHDHVGLAGEIQRESDATVYVHEADAAMVETDETGHEAEIEARNLFDRWGVPDEKAAELLDFLDGHDDLRGPAPTVQPIRDGERFEFGDVALEAVHLPGHAAGLAGFAFDGDDGCELFAGDALLPHYTPNVGGADPRVEDPLGAYLDSLERIVERDFARAWPGHRDPIADPRARAREIMNHHRERTERVLAVLREQGPADPWTVSAELFGELSNIHIMHGPGEAWAHLEHLARCGVVTAVESEYELDDPNPDLDELFDYRSEPDAASVSDRSR